MADFISRDSITDGARVESGAPHPLAVSGDEKIASFTNRLEPVNIPACRCGGELAHTESCHCVTDARAAGTMSKEAIYIPSQEGYGAKRNWSAVAITTALHVVAASVLLSTGYAVVKRPPSNSLEVLTLSQQPPEPMPPSPPQPEPLEVQERLAPDTIVLKAPAIIKVAPTPAPQPAKAVATAVATAPAKQAAPVVPITPPDFNAAQLNNPAPAYPYLSRKAREQGVVLLRVVVTLSGIAKTLSIERSSGHDRLDKAALNAVKKWRFVPAQQAGQPIEAVVLVPVTFNLG